MRIPGPFGKSALKSILASGCAMVALVIGPSTGFANPKGGQVVSGNVQITAPSATEMVVKQGSDKAIINWQQFSIGAGEHTRFEQPSTSSVSLNRVVGSDPSAILGRLSANGKVMLVNPNGIMFGKDAKVDVNGLLATTHDISNEDFLADRYRFTKSGKPGATVVNDGTITAAEGGLVALVAPGVVNNGVIAARLGRVALAGGGAFALDLYGDELVRFVVPDSAAGSVPTADGQTLASYVSNTGTIIADGGIVALTADTVRSLVSNSVNTSGVIQAQTVSQKGGTIVLDAGPSGSTTVSGRIDATGTADGSKGGSIQVTGKAVSIKQNAHLDASGKVGGGEVLVGGSFRGGSGDVTGLSASIPIPARKPIRNAETTVVEAGAAIQTDATERGDGGTAVVWADGSTDFRGHVSATGGTQSGNGGLVEVSGKQSLVFGGTAYLVAQSGNTGTLLLDPSTLTIDDPVGTAPNTISAGTINALLATTHVSLYADNALQIKNSIYSSYKNVLYLLVGKNGTITINKEISIGGFLGIYTDFGGTINQPTYGYLSARDIQMVAAKVFIGGSIRADNSLDISSGGYYSPSSTFPASGVLNGGSSLRGYVTNSPESINRDGATNYASTSWGMGSGIEIRKNNVISNEKQITVSSGRPITFYVDAAHGQSLHVEGGALDSDITNVSSYNLNGRVSTVIIPTTTIDTIGGGTATGTVVTTLPDDSETTPPISTTEVTVTETQPTPVVVVPIISTTTNEADSNSSSNTNTLISVVNSGFEAFNNTALIVIDPLTYYTTYGTSYISSFGQDPQPTTFSDAFARTSANSQEMQAIYRDQGASLASIAGIALLAADSALEGAAIIPNPSSGVTGVIKLEVKKEIKGALKEAIGFRDTKRRDAHYQDHGKKDFGASSPAEYEQKAKDFLSSPHKDGVYEKVRDNGDIVRYNQKTEEFGTMDKDGIIRTYYKPDPNVHGYPTNMDYFNAQ